MRITRLTFPRLVLRRFNSTIHDTKVLGDLTNEETVFGIIKNHKLKQTETYEPQALSDIDDEILSLLQHPEVDFNNLLLARILRLKLNTETNIKLISEFYNHQPKGIIDKATSLVPLRQCLFNGDIQNALKITDMTVGHPNYVEHKDKIFKRNIARLIGSSISISIFSRFGIEELIQLGWVSSGWSHMSAISSLIITYLLNSTFLLTIVRLGRTAVASGGDYLTWQKGTFYTHWYKHADEMMMCSKIVEADIKLTGGGISGGEPSESLKDELSRINPHNTMKPVAGYNKDGEKIRLMRFKDNIEDITLQAYWMSGGEGFEWVEPDQDPADILWRNNLMRQKLETSSTRSIKWAEQLIEDTKN